MYSAQLLDHFQNPRHAGDVPEADATAEVENPVCGDVFRLTLRVRDQQITEVGFKAKGCVPVMACGSALGELVQGKTLEQAKEIEPQDVIGALGGIPSASAHAPQLAVDALRAALRQITPQDRLPPMGSRRSGSPPL